MAQQLDKCTATGLPTCCSLEEMAVSAGGKSFCVLKPCRLAASCTS